MSKGEEISRRRALGLLGTAGAVALSRVPHAGAELHDGVLRTTRGLDCIATPEQTEGPYFVDELLNRADIRRDPTTDIVKEGLPLRLRINVSRLDGTACSPLEGAMVDVWHCDATGVYSGVLDGQGSFDTRGQKFLRGYQLTDRNGATEFVTIYPGWYSGRTVHIHFKVRADGGDGRQFEFTSQLYFDDEVSDRVLTLAPYDAQGTRRVRNGQDGIFRSDDSATELMLHLTPDSSGYLGTFNVGLQMA